jgi:hypothetical protein
MDRRHRWIRGDWQLAGWLLPLVPGPDGRRLRNPLSALSLWKLADNLRRSLVPAALVLILGLGWTVLPRAWLWTLAVIAILVMPSASALVADLLRKPEDVPFAQHLAAIAQAARRHAAQALMTLALLPDEATANLDAIVRTGWRMLVSHRRLLEWNPSTPDGPDSIAHARRSRSAFATAVGRTGIGPYVAVAIAASMALTASSAWIVAAPILVLWLASPVLAWWVSRPIAPREARLTPDQVRFLRTLARRTWAFFESFVGPPDHFLPPDNWQEHPIATVAHRTSPTNMGLALLANLTAYDFGYLPCGGLVERTGDTLRTMAAMERHDGHFYNWYDTQTLKPLTPLYVSAVDSGNLAGHLMTLRPGLVALADDPIVTARVFEGLADTLRCVTDALRGPRRRPSCACRRCSGPHCASPPATIPAAREALEHLGAAIAEVGDPRRRAARRRAAGATRGAGDAAFWSETLVRQCRALVEELAFLAPWTTEVDRHRGARACRRCASSPPFPWTASTKGTASRRSRATRAAERLVEIERLAQQCEALADMDYGFLYDATRHLLAIGYNVAERRRDSSCYDLLASEARLASFVAIAQGRLPQENWFALGRLLTTAGGESVLLSWSGSMFEILMPMLVMPTYAGTLIDQTCRTTVKSQIAYGKLRGVPWGISESGYNAVDAGLNYPVPRVRRAGAGPQARARDDLVVAPYASALALMVAPEAACQNLQRLSGRRARGTLRPLRGDRLHRRARAARPVQRVVRSFMAHHQGMILLSLAHRLLDRPLQRRFESDPQFKATLLLLQERIPRAAPVYSHPAELSAFHGISEGPEAPVRVLANPDTPVPEVQLLSNGRYHVMVTSAGGGSSRWKDLAGHALARGQHARRVGHVLLPARRGARRLTGRPPTSPRARPARTTKRSSPRAAPSSAAATTTSRRTPRSSSRRRTTSSCAASASPIRRARGAPSTSRATPKSCSRRPPPMRCTRRSRTCSCRPSSWTSGRRSSARGARARATRRRRRCSTR